MIVGSVKVTSYLTDEMWNGVASRLATGDLATFNPPVPANTGQIFAKLVEQQACMTAINIDSASAAKADNSQPAQLALVPSTQGLISHDSSGAWPDGTCGGFWWPESTGVAQAVSKAQQQALLTVQNQIRPILESLAAGKSISLTSAYEQFKNTWWQASMQAKAATTTPINTQNIANDGWAGAGAFYQKLGIAAHDAIAASSLTPNTTAIRSDLLPVDYMQTFTILSDATKGTIEQFKQQTEGSTPASEDAGALGWLIHPFLRLQATLIDTIHSQPDPMLRMQSMGHVMLDTWWTLNTVSTASKLIPNPAVKAVGAMVPENSSGFMIVLLIFGAALAYVIPMIPYIFFTLTSVRAGLWQIPLGRRLAESHAVQHPFHQCKTSPGADFS